MFLPRLSVVTDSPSPIVVVLSGSMEPAFQRGDLLFLCTTTPEFPRRLCIVSRESLEDV